MVFSAVSMDSSFQVVDLVWVGESKKRKKQQLYASLRHTDAVPLLACDTYGFCCDCAFMVLLADQHRKRSCLAGASTCFWTQCTEYLQQVTQSAVSAGTLYRRLYHFSTVLGKHLSVKTGTCRSGGGSDSGDTTLLAHSTFLALACLERNGAEVAQLAT